MTSYAMTPSESKSVSKNGQVQLRAHARAAFISQSIGQTTNPFAMLFQIELA
jgi:hypothetical protein